MTGENGEEGEGCGGGSGEGEGGVRGISDDVLSLSEEEGPGSLGHLWGKG